MSDIRKAREELLKLVTFFKEQNKPAVAKRITTIVDTYMMRSHVGVAQGPKSVKRASKKAAPAKKAPAKKPAPKKTPAKKKAPVKKAAPIAPAGDSGTTFANV